jgi:rhodanese-related sulfurtransferase
MVNVSSDEIKARLDAGEDLNLLDVREPFENAEYNIGGTLLPVGNIRMLQIDEIENWKDKEVICYCRSGKRSVDAALVLESAGFTNVKNLVGGMLEWQAKFG